MVTSIFFSSQIQDLRTGDITPIFFTCVISLENWHFLIQMSIINSQWCLDLGIDWATQGHECFLLIQFLISWAMYLQSVIRKIQPCFSFSSLEQMRYSSKFSWCLAPSCPKQCEDVLHPFLEMSHVTFTFKLMKQIWLHEY